MTTGCLPVDGSPAGLTLAGSTLFLWWGPDTAGTDCVASANGLAYQWATAEHAWTAAELNGWPGSQDRFEQAPSVIEVDPALAWLRNTRASLDPVAGLNLWNIAGDIAHSTGQPWADQGRIRNVCYDKLVAANVPWLFDRDAYRPRWTAPELNTLRTVLGQAIHVLRTGIEWESGPPHPGPAPH